MEFGKAILVMLILMMLGCDQKAIENNGIAPEVYFCPADNCQEMLISLVRSSDTIECAFYDLDLPELISELDSSDARLVIDERNYYENEQRLQELSDQIRVGKPNHQMHNKFCIFDDEIVATGSFNPTERGNYKNNNNLLLVQSEYLASNYLDEFEELWDGTFGDGSGVRYEEIILNGKLIRNYFCPEDCNPSIYTDAIDSADSSVIFMTFSFTHDDIGDALIRAYDRGIDVKGVFEKTQSNRWNEYPKLEEAGIPVRWDTNKANMHHKTFVIDGEIVITGSANPSNNGLNVNDENIVVLDDEDIAHEFLTEFEMNWNS